MSDEQPGEGKGIYYVAGAFCLPDLLSRLKRGGRRAQPPQVSRRGAPGGYQTGQGFQAEQSLPPGKVLPSAGTASPGLSPPH